MVSKQIVIRPDDAGDFEKAVAQVFDVIKWYPDYTLSSHSCYLDQYRCILFLSPAPSFEYHLHYESRYITFAQHHKARIDNAAKRFEVEHLWKMPGGYALVKEFISFMPAGDSETSHRLGASDSRRVITLMDTNLKDSGYDRLVCDLAIQEDMDVMMHHHRLAKPGSKSVCQDEIKRTDSECSMTSTPANGDSEPHTPVDDDPVTSNWLIDFDDSPLGIPALEATNSGKVDTETLSAIKVAELEKTIQHREIQLQARESKLKQREHNITIQETSIKGRESTIDIRERNLQSSWTRYGSFDFATQKLELDLQKKESAMDQRGRDIENAEYYLRAREDWMMEQEKKLIMQYANVKERADAVESLEESVTLRNKLSLERQDRLDEREQLAILDRNGLKAGVEKVTRREEKVKKREVDVRGAEGVMRAREATLREEQSKLPQAARRLRMEKERADAALTDRELSVLEREQRVQALETTLKVEREIIQTRFRDGEEMMKK
ncbi:hypothetical protein DSL72_006864 [Monilinia vaccinii-corymbosi]|uniref:Uncharacterized protein n=1 Tax=Monilinia vaccinii-corymbosi TaxID=61207 RepID=A0A8A3PK61_9HELO|nr:hypothetical protein DSL72_006864 [Monilinia vaccinii-corymbosi]